MNNEEHKWHIVHTILTVVLGALAMALMSFNWITHPLRLWFVLLVLFLGLLIVLGRGITGCFRGVFIDNRNVISLSRFQIVLWTLLILSAFSAAIHWNICAIPDNNPLNINIPEELWFLMGISVTSLVASPMLLDAKKNRQPAEKEKKITFGLISQRQGNTSVSNQGQIVINKNINDARWTDMFTGEETGNAAHVDFTRVQMFFFTIVALLCYAVQIAHLFMSDLSSGITKFPELSQGLIALIAISHTGYLTAKTLPQSQNSSSNAAIEQDEDELDCCHQHSLTEITEDEDLPASEGGVAP
jgi:hypothetical protein